MTEVTGKAVLKDFPLRIWQRQQEYTHDLLREFQLLVAGHDMGQHEVPHRLLTVADTFVTRYAGLVDALTAERQGALDAGLVKIDSVVPLPPETPDLILEVRKVLAEVEEYCRKGDLLMLAAPSDVASLREWSMEEALRQFRGEPPTPWAGSFD